MFQFGKNAFSNKMDLGNDTSYWSKSKMFENGHEYIYKEQGADFYSLKISLRLPEGSFW